MFLGLDASAMDSAFLLLVCGNSCRGKELRLQVLEFQADDPMLVYDTSREKSDFSSTEYLRLTLDFLDTYPPRVDDVTLAHSEGSFLNIRVPV